MSDAQAAELDVIHRFLLRIAEDRSRGGLRTLPEYQAAFPGNDELLAAEYAACGDGSGTEPEGQEPQRIGPYEIVRELGRGGQGVVYLADDSRLPRQVALKVLRGWFAGDDDPRLARFRREAGLAARLDHPSICRIIDVGREGDTSYLAMTFVPGATLARQIDERRRRAADPPTRGERASRDSSAARREVLDAVALVQSCAEAVHVAHEAGIVHRDLKPGNVMIAPDGVPVILDFGLARAAEADHEALTATGDFLGTPAYMAPEQVSGGGEGVDRRTDVYALGVMLYECVTLERPFQAPTLEALYRSILDSTPADARRRNPAVSADLRGVLSVAMDKDPARRYQTAADFAEDLRRVRASEPILARPPGAAGRILRWARRRPAAAALVIALALGLPAIAGLAGWILANLPKVEAQRREDLARRVEAELERGHAELAEGDPRRAIESFAAALRLRPDAVEALAGEALAHLRMNDAARALALLEAAAGRGGRAAALDPIRVEALRAAGREAEAAQLDGRLESPRDAAGMFVVAQRLVAEGHRTGAAETWRRAWDALEDAIRMSRHARPLFAYELAHVAGHLKDLAAARRAVRALETLWGERGEAWFWAGVALMDVDLPAGEAAFRRHLSAVPDNVRAMSDLARVLCNQGRLAEGEQVFREALKLRPREFDLHADLGYALDLQERFAEAAEQYRLAAEAEPRRAGTWASLGDSLQRAGDSEGALDAFARALALAPGDAGLHQLWLQSAWSWLRSARAAVEDGPSEATARTLDRWVSDEKLRALASSAAAPLRDEWERFWKSAESLARRAAGR